MTCEERQRHWNDRLDSSDGSSASFEPEWDAHLDSCERCRAVSAGFERLRDAIELKSSLARPSPGSLARLEALGNLRMTQIRRRSRLIRFGRFAAPLGLAASVAAAAWFGRPPDRPVATDVASPALQAWLAPSSPATVVIDEVLTPHRVEPAKIAGRSTRLITKRAGSPLPDSARYAFDFLLGPEGPPTTEPNGGL